MNAAAPQRIRDTLENSPSSRASEKHEAGNTQNSMVFGENHVKMLFLAFFSSDTCTPDWSSSCNGIIPEILRKK